MILVGDYIPKMKQVELNLPFEGTILANLESPVVGDAVLTPSLKSGPNLKSRSLGTERTDFIFNLANNHTMDYGAEGLHLTQDLLRKKGIPFVGAGDDIEAARKPIIVEEAGKKIGIIGCREPQFGSAAESRAGCADMGLWIFDAVRELKGKCDYVIVSCHSALEHSPFPSPKLREFYHHLMDAGADIIHGHHSHVPQGWEAYGNGVIFYGLGNFVVDPAVWGQGNRNYLWSNVAEVQFGDKGFSWSVSPCIVSGAKNTILVTQVDGENAEYCAQYNTIAVDALQTAQKLEGYWQEVCCRLFDKLYGMPLHCPGFDCHRLTLRNRARYLMDALFDVVAAVVGRKVVNERTRVRAANFYNSFLCSSHVEAITTACAIALGDATDLRQKQMGKDCDFMEVDRI